MGDMVGASGIGGGRRGVNIGLGVAGIERDRFGSSKTVLLWREDLVAVTLEKPEGRRAVRITGGSATSSEESTGVITEFKLSASGTDANLSLGPTVRLAVVASAVLRRPQRGIGVEGAEGMSG